MCWCHDENTESIVCIKNQFPTVCTVPWCNDANAANFSHSQSLVRGSVLLVVMYYTAMHVQAETVIFLRFLCAITLEWLLIGV